MFRMTPGAETAIMRHGAVDTTGDPRRSTLKTTADWTKALERLIESPNADLSDLIAEWKTRKNPMRKIRRRWRTNPIRAASQRTASSSTRSTDRAGCFDQDRERSGAP